ncbi:MAG: hypothetical protein HN366_20020 [Deltaproteobacteria bacterium]|nr:hypothetical protein [Deltaproteobacteria bacterium]MBT6498809.1 hypothetical protein [Deltaproteobacteria bacterium]
MIYTLIELGTSEVRLDLPAWANCVSREWQALDQLGLVGKELLSHLEAKLNEACAPLDAHAGWDLENAISVSFREVRNRPLSRWEAKVRFALSAVLFPYASKRDFQKIELALRVFNPALPEITLTPGFASPAKAVFNAISEKNYVGAIGNAEFFFLGYHELIERDEDRRWTYLEALAVIIPSSTVRRGFFAPSVDASFRSKELPDFGSATTSHETCWHLRPDFSFFGSFTPAFPLQTFAELIGARDSDFFRVSWRNGRTGDVSNCGRPVQEGCLLAVKRTAVRLPSDKKLAWILKVDGETVTMVDSQNNLLV